MDLQKNREISDLIKAHVDYVYKKFIANIEIRTDARELLMATFFATQLEYSKALAALIETNNLIGLPSIFRSFFEAHIDLVNICYHKNYHLALIEKSEKELIKQLENLFKEKTNSFLPNPESTGFDVGKVINEKRASVENLEKQTKQFKDVGSSIKEKIKLAGLDVTYFGIYKILNPQVHNDIHALESRHINEKNGRITLSIDNVWTFSDVGGILVTIAPVLTRSLMLIFEYFGMDLEEFDSSIDSQILDQITSIIDSSSS